MALSVVPASVWPPVLSTTLHYLGTLGEFVPMLAMYTLFIAGRTGGPEGLPPIPEIILLTFVLWWVIVELVRALPPASAGRSPTRLASAETAQVSG
jgi:hypothetical protein